MAKLLERIGKQFKNHAEWWSDYMTEMSILVISLAATFYGENLIESYNEAREDYDTMALVVDELEYNEETLAVVEEHYALEKQFAGVLNRALNHHEVFPRDTLDKYLDFHYDIYYYFWKNNAFDLIKLSGTMQRIDNKDLSLQLFVCYEWLEVVKEMDANFREERKAKRADFLGGLKNGMHAETTAGQWEQINENKIFKRYLLYSMPSTAKTIHINAREARQAVAKTIGMIKEEYGIP